jgi:uncharacterized OsmC-like protein
MIFSIAESNASSQSASVKVGKHLLSVSLQGELEDAVQDIRANELFSSAISSSICSAVQRHIVLKKWDVSYVHVSVSIFDAELKNNNTYFHCDVKLKGKLSDAQLAELDEVVQRADVYRMLNSQLELNLEMS